VRERQALHALVLGLEGEVEPPLGESPVVGVEFLQPGLEPVAAADGFDQQVEVAGHRVPSDVLVTPARVSAGCDHGVRSNGAVPVDPGEVRTYDADHRRVVEDDQ